MPFSQGDAPKVVPGDGKRRIELRHMRPHMAGHTSITGPVQEYTEVIQHFGKLWVSSKAYNQHFTAWSKSFGARGSCDIQMAPRAGMLFHAPLTFEPDSQWVGV
jgi:hypothetical protein